MLEKATEYTRKEGYARNFEKLGGEEQAVLDFEKRNPINRCLKETKYGQGIFAELSTGATIMYRPNSKTGGATLEIRVSSRKIYKIRYRRR